jgi:hypothetical protein
MIQNPMKPDPAIDVNKIAEQERQFGRVLSAADSLVEAVDVFHGSAEDSFYTATDHLRHATSMRSARDIAAVAHRAFPRDKRAEELATFMLLCQQTAVAGDDEAGRFYESLVQRDEVLRREIEYDTRLLSDPQLGRAAALDSLELTEQDVAAMGVAEWAAKLAAFKREVESNLAAARLMQSELQRFARIRLEQRAAARMHEREGGQVPESYQRVREAAHEAGRTVPNAAALRRPLRSALALELAAEQQGRERADLIARELDPVSQDRTQGRGPSR